MLLYYNLLIFLFKCRLRADILNDKIFPRDFLIGVGSSAYQIEGAWNANGKEHNVWDTFTHQFHNQILDSSNADVACDSYKYYQEDVELLKDLGANVYKFSISWSRILSFGKINHDGLDYYNKLIDALVAEGITPMATLFHWDTPAHIQVLGGWTNPLTQIYFLEYARLAFENFGDRVKYWITFNDPMSFCLRSYGDGDENFAPNINISGRGVYICSYVVLKSHAAAYDLYKNNFKKNQKGYVSISLMAPWCEPSSNKQEDIEASERLYQFQLGLFANPIYGDGTYPNVVKTTVNKISLAKGYLVSRLPSLTAENIKGTFDFFALNFYSAVMVSSIKGHTGNDPSFSRDANVITWYDENWNSSSLEWLKVTPWALRKVLSKIKKEYGNVPIFVTENGFADDGDSEDYDRIYYHQTYLSSLMDSVYEDKVNVIGYIVWSLMDSFEWSDGYTTKFGLYQVDFDSLDRPRIPKLSSIAIKEITKNRRLPSETINKP